MRCLYRAFEQIEGVQFECCGEWCRRARWLKICPCVFGSVSSGEGVLSSVAFCSPPWVVIIHICISGIKCGRLFFVVHIFRFSLNEIQGELTAAQTQRDDLYAKQSRGSKYNTAEERDAALRPQVKNKHESCTLTRFKH